jgi:6-pyruvoyl-tetrahydropterin synthase
MSISYTRTFAIEAAHFNGQKAYDTYYRLRETADVSNEEVLDLIKDVHGHNFRIVVEITLKDCDYLDQSGFAIDDEKLEQIIRRYDRINISVHDDFTTTGDRATTEHIAHNYANLIFNKCDRDRLRFSSVTVRVHETNDIFATAVVWC